MSERPVTDQRLRRDFFARGADDVARDLVGARLVVRRDGRVWTARIVETEAYGGADDPASHAFRGPTPRCEVMFAAPGALYVYRSYGLHWCMNVVTEAPGAAGAVLLRGAELWRGDRGEAGGSLSAEPLRGPGILARGLGVTGADNGHDCCARTAAVCFRSRLVRIDDGMIGRSPRVGLSKARERMSRYFLIGSPAVSSHSR
jgi:DNA-3-methyladenine glycosylase